MLGISVARESKKISEFTLKDSNVLKSVTALTALLLPPTFTAVCFFLHIVLSFFRCWAFFFIHRPLSYPYSIHPIYI